MASLFGNRRSSRRTFSAADFLKAFAFFADEERPCSVLDCLLCQDWGMRYIRAVFGRIRACGGLTKKRLKAYKDWGFGMQGTETEVRDKWLEILTHMAGDTNWYGDSSLVSIKWPVQASFPGRRSCFLASKMFQNIEFLKRRTWFLDVAPYRKEAFHFSFFSCLHSDWQCYSSQESQNDCSSSDTAPVETVFERWLRGRCLWAKCFWRRFSCLSFAQ